MAVIPCGEKQPIFVVSIKWMRKTFKYRVYPTKQQTALLEWTLSSCHELYNAALQERRDAWRVNRESINFAGQSAQLVEIKQVRPELNAVYSQVLQDTLHRVDKTFKAFFARVKRKAKAGFPRFRSRARFDSFTYPQLGFSVKGTHLCLSKIGKVKIKLHRPIEGRPKTLTIKREAGRWYACFSIECEAQPLPVNTESVGVDGRTLRLCDPERRHRNREPAPLLLAPSETSPRTTQGCPPPTWLCRSPESRATASTSTRARPQWACRLSPQD